MEIEIVVFIFDKISRQKVSLPLFLSDQYFDRSTYFSCFLREGVKYKNKSSVVSREFLTRQFTNVRPTKRNREKHLGNMGNTQRNWGNNR